MTTDATLIELKSCPFCGEDGADAHLAGSAWFIGGHHKDGCHFADFQRTKAEAIAAWNQRATDPTSNVKNEALKKCAERFREYEANHQEKANHCLAAATLTTTPGYAEQKDAEAQSREAKAARNREMAELCEAALSLQPEPQLSEEGAEKLLDAKFRDVGDRIIMAPARYISELRKAAIAAILAASRGDTNG